MGFAQSGFAIAHRTCKTLTESISKNPTEWLELDIKNGGAPISGRRIELPILWEEYVTGMEGYLAEIAHTSLMTSYLNGCSNIRIFRKKGEHNYYICTDAPFHEIGNAVSYASSRIERVYRNTGLARIADYS